MKKKHLRRSRTGCSIGIWERSAHAPAAQRETAAADTTAATAGTQAAGFQGRGNHSGRGGDHPGQCRTEGNRRSRAAGAACGNPQCSERGVLASKGYELKIVEYTDYVQPNNALDSGDLDANYFQHKPYLDSFLMRRTEQSWSAQAPSTEPFGIYAGKTASLEELPDKATRTGAKRCEQ